MIRAEWRRSRQGKKVADGRCGRTIEAQPLSDQTCHIEDVVAAPVLIKPDGFRRWRAVIAKFHLLPLPMQSPAAPRARPFLVRARPDRALLRSHPALLPRTMSAAVSSPVAARCWGWRALTISRNSGGAVFIAHRPIRVLAGQKA